MPLYFVSALLLVTSVASANTPDPEVFVERFNRIFNQGIPVCNSEKAEAPDKPGYHIAEVTKLDGTKEMRRVPQNTLGKFKNMNGTYVSEFSSYRWDKKSLSSKTEISYLRIERSQDGKPRLNMYDKNNNFQAGHAIGYSTDGEVEFVLSEATAVQPVTGLEHAGKDAEFYYYVIRSSKVEGTIHYTVDDLSYEFPKAVREQIEKETGKFFFTDKLDQNGTAYIGNVFSIEEIRALSKKYGIEARFGGAKPWKNCPLPTPEDLLAQTKKSAPRAVAPRAIASEKK